MAGLPAGQLQNMHGVNRSIDRIIVQNTRFSANFTPESALNFAAYLILNADPRGERFERFIQGVADMLDLPWPPE